MICTWGPLKDHRPPPPCADDYRCAHQHSTAQHSKCDKTLSTVWSSKALIPCSFPLPSLVVGDDRANRIKQVGQNQPTKARIKEEGSSETRSNDETQFVLHVAVVFVSVYLRIFFFSNWHSASSSSSSPEIPSFLLLICGGILSRCCLLHVA